MRSGHGRAPREIAELVVVANTPAYLLRRLRENGIVAALARSYAATDLLKYAHALFETNKEHLTLTAASHVYAALVAAIMRPAPEFDDALRKVGVPSIRWATDFVRQAKETPSTNAQTIIVTDRITAVSSHSAPPSSKPVGHRVVLE